MAGSRVADVGSLNGTYLKRGRIDTATLLSSGDEVQVGKFRLTFLAASPARSEPPECERGPCAAPAQLSLADDLPDPVDRERPEITIGEVLPSCRKTSPS